MRSINRQEETHTEAACGQALVRRVNRGSKIRRIRVFKLEGGVLVHVCRLAT